MSKEFNPFGDPFDDQFKAATTVPTDPPAAAPDSSQSQIRTDILDNYNPFDEARPAVLPAVPGGNGPPPAYSASAAQRVTVEELERRQHELDTRADELRRREEDQRIRENEARKHYPGGDRTNNWPVLPRFLPCSPCFYQDIDVDIPAEYRIIVRLGYYLWISHSVLLGVNFIGTLAFFIGSSAEGSSGSTFGTSILLLLLFIPASYICWFRPLYKAFRADSSFNFFIFFFVVAAQCVVSVIQTLGINYLASCGWINSLGMMGKNKGVGALMLIISVMFTAITVADVILLIKVHRLYRSTGASFAKAKDEFSHGVATNNVLRGSATQYGSSLVSGRDGSAGAGAGNRF